MAEKKTTSYSNFYGGITVSKHVQNGFADLVNCDIHSDIGSVRPQLALENEDGGAITEGCYVAVAPNGDSYFFSAVSGNIHKRTQAGVYSAVRINSNGVHKSCHYYNGFIYYTTDAHLGRFNLDVLWNDNFQNLTAGKQHAMEQFDLILYICDGHNIASVDDADAFTSSTLDLPVQYNSSALLQYGDDLLILANSDYINDSKIFRWDTYSSSWRVVDAVKEANVFALLDADNFVYVIAKSGKIYLFDGVRLEHFKRVAPFTNPTAQLTANYKGKPLIANGTIIYSLHREDRSLSFSLCKEYTAPGEITSLRASGDDLLVSYDGGVANVGTARAVAVIETPLTSKRYSQISVGYESLPTGTSIEIATSEDGATFLTQEVIVDDEDGQVVHLDADCQNKRTLQARITLTSLGSLYPVIDDIKLYG